MDESIQERLREAAEAIRPPVWWVFKYATPRDAWYEQGEFMTYCPACLRSPGQTRQECESRHYPPGGCPVLYSPHQQCTSGDKP